MAASLPSRRLCAAPSRRHDPGLFPYIRVMSNDMSIVLGGGCFWCLDAAFRLLPGVLGVESGYSGGFVDDPDYERVCRGDTGHAEVVRVRFDPARLSWERLFAFFFALHDPTTPDRQGADRGPQYRSIILYAGEAQKAAAEAALAEARKLFEALVVTELAPLSRFWPAEDWHQDYFRKNPDQGYCRMVVRPKVDKAARFAASS